MRPYVAELSRIASCLTSAHPNAGLPNAFGDYDETPDVTSALLHEFARDGFLNIAGSCCGSTPSTRRRSPPRSAASSRAPSRSPRRAPRFSGLEPFEIGEDTGFVIIGERTNVTGSARFRRLVEADDFNAAVDVALEQVRGGANLIDVNMDADLLEGEQAMRTFLNVIATEPEVARLPVMVDSSKWTVLEAGLQCTAGQGDRQLDLAEGGGGGVSPPRAPHPRLRRGCRRDGVRRGRAGDGGRSPRRDLRPRVRPARPRGRFPARGHRLRPQRARRRNRDRGARRLRSCIPRGAAEDQGALPRRAHLGRDLEPQLLVPRQRRHSRGDARRVPLPRDPRRARHGHRQRRAARGLRGHRTGAEGARGGRALQPSPRRDRAPRRDRRPVPGRGHEARARPAVAGGPGREASRACARTRDRRLHRGRHRGGTAERRASVGRDRGAPDGRHARRRRPLRLRSHVPAAGREIGPRDEARCRVPAAVHGGREGRHPRRAGQGAAGDGQGRRARHREEHRRSRPRLQRLRGDRPRGDGAAGEDPRHRRSRTGRHRRALGPDHPVARPDGRRRARDGPAPARAAADDRRRDDVTPAHGRQDRAGVRERDGARPRCEPGRRRRLGA